MLKKFIKYYIPYKKILFLDMSAAFLISLLDLVYPMITRSVINNIVPNKNLKMLVILTFVLVVIFVFKALLNYIMQYYGNIIGVRMQGDMREKIFEHLHKMPSEFFTNNKTGCIMSTILNSLNEISDLAHRGAEEFFTSVVMLVGSFVLLLTINVKLTIISFSLLPFICMYIITKRKKMNEAFQESREQIGEVTAILENSISGINVTKAFSNEKNQLNKFKEINSHFKNAKESAYKKIGEFFSGTYFLVDMLEVIVLAVSGYFTFNGTINIGDFTAFLLYVKMFTSPIRKLINFYEQFQYGISGFKRLDNVLSMKVEEESPSSKILKDVKGNIEIQNVSFKYKDGEEYILKNFSLNIESGKTIALVGPSGIGKATICNLIPRFYEPTKGRIKIDGISIKDVTLRSLRKNIGILSKDVFLFTGTIKENVAIGNENVKYEEIIEACKKATIHQFIMSLKDEYNTFIGVGGLKLSESQKQKISIARAFIKNPKIMILDEAIFDLDDMIEKKVQDSLEELFKGKTNIIVAHRLSTVKKVDEIILIGKEGIIEKGTHEELMSKNGSYKELYDRM